MSLTYCQEIILNGLPTYFNLTSTITTISLPPGVPIETRLDVLSVQKVIQEDLLSVSNTAHSFDLIHTRLELGYC